MPKEKRDSKESVLFNLKRKVMKKIVISVLLVVLCSACSKGFRVSFGVTPVSAINESQYFNEQKTK